ncbi:MAG: hypothetical protein IJS14_01190 [Lentisphaeria bacterium]|nr:hypothetical protein [Lentisphaeria bacterium]
MKSLFAIAISAAVLALPAQVNIVKSPLSLDADPNGPGWKTAAEQSDFKLLKASGKTNPAAQTSFKVAADADNLYLCIVCKEDKMDQLRKSKSPSSMWSTDSVEIFLAPSGQSDEFYQFVVTAGNLRHSMFYGEAGVIRPDPYQPFWESEVFYGKDYWMAKLRIPFSAFYMTRNEKWKSEWMLNISRSRMTVRELSTWSPLVSKFMEPQNFRKFTGFPKRDPAQDVAILKADPVIQDCTGGVYSGPLELTAEVNPAAAGTYDLRVEEPDGKSSEHTVTLKAGANKIVLPKVEYLRRSAGVTRLKLTLKSRKSGVTLGRHYPVEIVYEPVRAELAAPGYRRNFYPGQDYSKISGLLKLRISSAQQKNAEVKVTLSGGGLTEKTQTFKADRDTIPFSFDSSALTEGGKAILSVKLTDGGREIASVSQTITRLKKNSGSMVWIENGVIVKNGKPWYPRHIYAFGYHGGEAFMERYKSDDLAVSPFRQATLEPARLVKGIEAKEATKNVKPCPELFEKVRKVVERKRNDPDFDCYYISDEPECRRVSPVYLKYIYDFVSELDPYHPIATCSRAADRYIECADIFSTHPYLGPVVSGGKRVLNVPVDRIRSYLQDVTKFKRPDKVVGFTGQFFGYKFNNLLADYPTWEELESMSWSAIAQGSRFHYPYAFHDLGDRPQIYEAYRYFNQSIRALEKQLLSNRKYPVKADDPENMLDTLLVEGDGVTLLIAVNLKNGPLETTVSADQLKKFTSLMEFRGNGSREIVNGELKLSLRPYECVVLTSKKMDGGLKTRDLVVKEVADANKARKARGNLLFEKGATFEVDSSNPGKTLGIRNKLFDGTIDMLGWSGKRWSDKHWFELNFREKPPKFSKIGIYGLNVDRPTVRIWALGEWKTLTPKKTDKAKYSTVLDFGEELKSVKVRIDFAVESKQTPLELYEIELLNDIKSADQDSAAARGQKDPGKKTGQPADNTLWEETGRNIVTAPKPGFKRWLVSAGEKSLEIKSKEDGKGFTFYAPDGKGRKTVTRVNFSPDYPYLVFRITDFELLKGYRNWTMRSDLGLMTVSQVNSLHKGIFVFDLYQNLPEKEAVKKAGYLHFWIYNLRLDLEYLKLVKKPAYVVRAECADPEIKPGSKVKFTAELEEEAEDVSISLFTTGVPRTIKVNGKVKIQLKPADKTQKIWTAEIEVKSIGVKKPLKRFQSFMKMDVLGGDLDEPVWVGLPYPVVP